SAAPASRRSSSSTSTRTSSRNSARLPRASARSAPTSRRSRSYDRVDVAVPQPDPCPYEELLHELVDLRRARPHQAPAHGHEPPEGAAYGVLRQRRRTRLLTVARGSRSGSRGPPAALAVVPTKVVYTRRASLHGLGLR